MDEGRFRRHTGESLLIYKGQVSMRVAAFAAALALHAAPCLFLSRNEEPREPQALLNANSAPLPLRVHFLDATSAKGIELLSITSFELQFQRRLTLDIPMPSLQAVLSDSFEESQPILTSANEKEAARLQGIYKTQIFARLERALAEVAGTSTQKARCLINIIQDEKGRVLDVLTDECEASGEWKDRISMAVRLASPLPLPPQGLAMGSYLTLDFSTADSSAVQVNRSSFD
jgi:hypothetical protein